jgi:hypothetical protein
LSFCTFSFGHCIVCSSSIYGFWLPLWYLSVISHERGKCLRQVEHIRGHWWHRHITVNQVVVATVKRQKWWFPLHFEIDSEGWLRTKLYEKRDDFNFPIVNFSFICSNILAAPAYGVYISQLIRYSRACTGGELKCSGRVSSSCSASDTRRVTLVTNPIVSLEWGKRWIVIMTSGTYPWSFVIQILCKSSGRVSCGNSPNCVVCPLIYDFWLPIWYLITFFIFWKKRNL